MAVPTPRLYALADCAIQPIDARSMMLIRLDTGAVAAVDSRWRQFLDQLKVFRSLAEHAEIISRQFPELQGQRQALAESFKQLTLRGVLYSADEVLAQLERDASAINAEPAPLTLCIRTCDRPEALQRLLESCAVHARTFNHQWPIEVLEDSREAQHRSANAALAERFSQQLALRYIGFEQQTALLASLTKQTPDNTEALHWLLDPHHPDNSSQPSHGRLYNLAFLLHAGERILLLDDDTVLNAWRWPDAQPDPQFRLTSGSPIPMPDATSAQQVLTGAEIDPIAAHATALGHPVHAAIRASHNNRPESNCVHGSAIESVPHPLASPGRIRYTRNGFLGDTGSSNDQAFFYRLRIDAPALVLSPERYRHFRNAPRCTISAPKRPELLCGTHFHHTTCAGLDLTNFIPPVHPRGRSEDSVLGALLRLLYPQDYGMRLHFALEHRLQNAKPWQFGPEFAITTADAGEALESWISRLPAPAEITPQQRMQLLTDTITNLAAEGELSARIAAMLLHQQQEGAAVQFALTRSELSAATARAPEGDAPIPPQSLWREELNATSQHLLSRLQSTDTPHIDAKLTNGYAELFQRYAAAIPAWQTAFALRVQYNAGS